MTERSRPLRVPPDASRAARTVANQESDELAWVAVLPLGLDVPHPSAGFQVAALAILACIILAFGFSVIRRRRRGHGRWWQGPSAPQDEPISYQRRDDSGQA